jgi:hypothetical protein
MSSVSTERRRCVTCERIREVAEWFSGESAQCDSCTSRLTRVAAKGAALVERRKVTRVRAPRALKETGLAAICKDRLAREREIARSPKLQAAVQLGLVIGAEVVGRLYARGDSIPGYLLIHYGIVFFQPLVALDVRAEVLARAVEAGRACATLSKPLWMERREACQSAFVTEEIAALMHLPEPEREERDDGEDEQDLAA